MSRTIILYFLCLAAALFFGTGQIAFRGVRNGKLVVTFSGPLKSTVQWVDETATEAARTAADLAQTPWAQFVMGALAFASLLTLLLMWQNLRRLWRTSKPR